MGPEEHRLLGEIKGKLDLVIGGQNAQNEKLESLDTRLRKVETKAAMNGAISGGMVAIGVSLLAETLKKKIGI